MPVEVANILRRLELSEDVAPEIAALAYADLLDLPVDLYPFDVLADRIWELRRTVTSYDAWYVALAESLGSALVTVDEKLAKANGPTCAFKTPGSA